MPDSDRPEWVSTQHPPVESGWYWVWSGLADLFTTRFSAASRAAAPDPAVFAADFASHLLPE